ncbi:unnamed protein product [Brassica oleracea]
MPCLVPQHGGGSIAGHEHRAKGQRGGWHYRQDRLARTHQGRSVVGVRRVSIGGKGSRTVEEPGEAGSFDGNGRRNPLIESPMKLREVNEFLEK